MVTPFAPVGPDEHVRNRRHADDRIAIPLVVGGTVAILLGTYGRLRRPTGPSSWHPLFAGMITFRSWSVVVALLCETFQVVSGITVHRRRDPRALASPLASAHRLSASWPLRWPWPLR